MADMDLKVRLKPDTKELDRALKGKKLGLGVGVGKKTPEGKELKVKGMGKLLGLIGGIGAILGALNFIIKPVAQLLSIILTLLFLPLLPVFLPALKALANFIPKMAAFSKKAGDLIQKLVNFFFGSKLGKFLLNPFGFIKKLLFTGLKGLLEISTLIWNDFIVPGFKFILDFGTKIWEEMIVPGWEFLKNVGELLWTTILFPAWNWFKDIGTKIWAILKIGFDFVKTTLISSMKKILNAVIDFVNLIIPGGKFDIPHFAQGGIVTKPTLAMVGEAGPEAIIPLSKGGGGVTININNPSIRSDQDIRRLTNEISRVMAGQLKRGFA